MKAWMIGGDARSTWAARALQASGWEVATLDVPQRADTAPSAETEAVIFPFPSFDGDRIRGERRLSAAELAERLPPAAQIFGGRFGALRELFSARGHTVHDLYGAEPLTTANAVPTAEGAIALAMDAAPITLHGARCLVIGFGRIGKALAPRLHALSAAVTVSVRRPADEGLVEALGLRSERTGRYLHGLSQYDFVFNTVPSPILDRTQLGQLSADCTLIDLSSPPYGIAPELCRALGRKCIYASGLPGKCAPKTAGILYARQIITESEESE